MKKPLFFHSQWGCLCYPESAAGHFLLLLKGSSGEEHACQCRDVRDAGSVPGSGRSPGEGNATHSGILAWEIPWTEEPGGLQSIGPQRARHDWSKVAHGTYSFKSSSDFFENWLCLTFFAPSVFHILCSSHSTCLPNICWMNRYWIKRPRSAFESYLCILLQCDFGQVI